MQFVQAVPVKAVKQDEQHPEDEVIVAILVLVVSQQDEQNPAEGPMDEVIAVDSTEEVIAVDSTEEVIAVDSTEEVFEVDPMEVVFAVDPMEVVFAVDPMEEVVLVALVELSVVLPHMDVLDQNLRNVPLHHSSYTAPYKASKNGHCTWYRSCDCNLYSFRCQHYIVDTV